MRAWPDRTTGDQRMYGEASQLMTASLVRLCVCLVEDSNAVKQHHGRTTETNGGDQ